MRKEKKIQNSLLWLFDKATQDILYLVSGTKKEILENLLHSHLIMYI